VGNRECYCAGFASVLAVIGTVHNVLEPLRLSNSFRAADGPTRTKLGLRGTQAEVVRVTGITPVKRPPRPHSRLAPGITSASLIRLRVWSPHRMKKSRRRSPKAVLRLPDLEHAKSAVLNSLASPESRRSYEFAIPKLRPLVLL
jgi:hypothetical protein